MPTEVQFRRANTADMASITGKIGELIVDTDKMVVVVHDGTTPGGHPLASAANPEFTGNAAFSVITVGDSTANVFANSTFLQVANSTRSMNVYSNRLKTGNVTVNTIAVAVGSNVVVNTSTVQVGNSTVNSVVNSSAIEVQTATVRTNTFSFGSSEVAANGYTVLGNNLVKVWGSVQANNSTGDVTFATAVGGVFSVQLTPQTPTHHASYLPVLIAKNTTTANIRTGNATAITVYYEVTGNIA